MIFSKLKFVNYDEFFASGMQTKNSPFITSSSRKWAKNLSLKGAISASIFLILSFLLSFTSASSISNLLLCFSYFFGGVPALISSMEDLARKELNINVLMTIGAFCSIVIGSPSEGALLLVLFSFSAAMEESVRFQAKSAIYALKKMSPTKAHLLHEDGSLSSRPLQDIQIGSTILVKAGEMVPLDGKIIAGESTLSFAHLTGEPLAQMRKVGDEIEAGATNLDRSLTLTILRKSSDSTLAKIINLITEAESAKPRLIQWFDRFSSRYATIIIISAFSIGALLPLVLSMPYLGIEGSIYRALSFLIGASPCALIIATPLAYLSAMSSLTKSGILVKGGHVLDSCSSAQIIAFDKTGTLTQGKLECISIEGEGSFDQALALASGLEKHVIHPISEALLHFAQKQGISPTPLENFQSVPGKGLEALFQKKPIFIGNRDYILPKLNEEKRAVLRKKAEEIECSGEMYTILLANEEMFFFRFSDNLKPRVKETLAALKRKWQISSIMLTGDHSKSAKKMGAEAGIDVIYSELLPEDKLRKVEEIARDHQLIMVGDGINDAPALARAHVGISMGKMGSKTAIDASDVVLLNDHIESLEGLIKKAKKTKRIIKENLLLAGVTLLVASLLALGGITSLWMSVLLHEGGTLLVGLNALRLLRSWKTT